jgi:hypothetical protein
MFIGDLFNKKKLNESLRDGEYVTFRVFFDDGTDETLNFSSDDIDWDRVGAKRGKRVVNVKRQGGIQGSQSDTPGKPHDFPDDRGLARAQRAYDRQLPEGVAEGADDTVKFEVDSENAYNHIMDKFGSVIEWDGDIMVAPRQYWGAIQELAYAAGGEASEEQDIAEAIPYALSAANAAAEYRRQGAAGGGYRGRIDIPVQSREDYLAVGNTLSKAARAAGQRIEYGLSDGVMSIFSDSMTADELDEFIDRALNQGLAEAHGPYGQIKPSDIEKIQKAKEREKKNAPGQLRRALPLSKQRYRDSSIEYFSKLDEQGVAEGSVQDKLHKRHQELRKKSGLPNPEYYRELRATYDLPDEERYAKAAELKKKYRVKESTVTNEDREKYLEEMQRAGYEIVTEAATLCPECGGPAYNNQMLAEKQDACYSKVKSRYKVWPSAYASGALVRCRKVGAKNWGNKSKK